MQGLDAFHQHFPTEHATKIALDLIGYYDLHQHPEDPVDISGLLANFDLRFLDLPKTTCGFTLDIDHKIIIALNQDMNTEFTRYVAMHEVGHVACWHPNQLNSCLEGQWAYNMLETEATTVAAYVLLPRQAVSHRSRREIRYIASHYQVPPELVQVRRTLLYRHGY